jgi:hypothetical protein
MLPEDFLHKPLLCVTASSGLNSPAGPQRQHERQEENASDESVSVWDQGPRSGLYPFLQR